MSLLPGSRLATVNVGTCCDKHDPVARQPELMRQIVAKSYSKSKTERYGGGGKKKKKRCWIQTSMKSIKKIFFKKVCGQLIKEGTEAQQQEVST